MHALGEQQRAERRLPRRLEHHRAAGGQGGRHLAHRQHQREIPGADGADHPDRRLHDQVPLALGLRRDDAAVGPAAFLGEPLEMVHGHGHLAQALGSGLPFSSVLIGGRPRRAGPRARRRSRGAARALPRERATGESAVRHPSIAVASGPVDGGHVGERLARGRIDDVQRRGSRLERPLR